MDEPTLKRKPRATLLTVALLAPAILALPTASAAPPANDDFDNAEVIPFLPFTDMLDANNATRAADDPTCFGGGRSVWYRFTAPANGTIAIDTNGSDYSTVMGLFRGTRGNLTSIGCASDPLGGSVTTFRATVFRGVTYHIMVSTQNNAPAGNLTLHVRNASAPIVLDARIDATAMIVGGRAILKGVATLDRPVPGPGTLCIDAQLGQGWGLSMARGYGRACVTGINNKTTIAWSVPVSPFFGAWRTGSASASITATFFAPNEADTDTASRTVMLRR